MSLRVNDVTEHPILMTGWSVRGIFADLKHQTRRLNGLEEINQHPDAWELTGMHNEHGWPLFGWLGGDRLLAVKCPFGQPGDRLWVRESFWIVERLGQGIEQQHLLYEEEMGKEPNENAPLRPICEPIRWGHRPAIYMPRWACRLVLELTGIRVERVQDISYQDMLAEGIVPPDRRFRTWGAITEEVRDEWIRLWDSINAKRGYGWDVNPWVWVLEFQRIRGNGGVEEVVPHQAHNLEQAGSSPRPRHHRARRQP